jgi:hypothetical protein
MCRLLTRFSDDDILLIGPVFLADNTRARIRLACDSP